MKTVLILTLAVFLPPTNLSAIIEKIDSCSITRSDEYELVDNVRNPSSMVQIRETFLEGDISATIQLLNEAIEADPFNEHLNFFRGKLYYQLQDYYFAKWDFLTVKILNPDYPNLLFYLKNTLIMLGELPSNKTH